MDLQDVCMSPTAGYRCHGFVALTSGLFHFLCFGLFVQVTPIVSKKKAQVANTVSSFVHAFISGVWALTTFIFILRHGSFITTSLNAELVLSFSIGFFVTDIMVLVLYRHQIKLIYAFIVHHLASIAVYSSAILYQIGVGYAIIAALAEVSNTFLHARKLMQYEGVSKTNIFYLINSMVGLFTTFCVRVLLYFFIFYMLRYVEDPLPTGMNHLVNGGFVIVTAFTVAILNALLCDFRPKVEHAKNGSAKFIASSKDD